MGKAKPSADDLRRQIGYTIITFLSIFLFIPVLWFIHLFSGNQNLFVRWSWCSAVLVMINVLFYYWQYPVNWLRNLLALVGIDLLILLFEYFWLIQG